MHKPAVDIISLSHPENHKSHPNMHKSILLLQNICNSTFPWLSILKPNYYEEKSFTDQQGLAWDSLIIPKIICKPSGSVHRLNLRQDIQDL